MVEKPEDQTVATELSEEEIIRSLGNSNTTRRWRRTASAAAVVAVLVVGNATANAAVTSANGTANPALVFATANAATRSADSSTAGPSTAGTPAARGDTAGSDAALHGEFSVINRDGSAQLRRWQSGSVNAIDQLSLTVRSADGFDSTYLLGPGVSVTGIGLGDDVTVVGAGQAVPGNA